MSRKVIVVGLLIVALLALSGLVLGQGLPGSGWLSGQQILNAGTGPADIMFNAYDSVPNSYTCGTDIDVPVGASVNYITSNCDDPALPAGFVGSGVVSADQPIKAMVNVTNEGTGTASGQYVGTDGSDTSLNLSFPLMKNDWVGRTSHFYIQNAGSVEATITATAIDQDGVSYGPYVVKAMPNAMVVIEPTSVGVPTSKYGSLAVEGSELLAGSMLESETTTAVAENLNASKGLSANDYDTVIYCPMIRNGWGAEDFGTGLQVINVGGAAQTIKVDYSYQVGSVAAPVQTKTVTTPSLDVGESFNLLSSDATWGIPDNSLGSATVTGASGDAAALVSDEGFNTSSPYNVATYTCFPKTSASIKVYAPLYKQDWIGDTSGIQIQNVAGDGSTATVHLTYTVTGSNATGNAGDVVVLSNTGGIADGASVAFFNADQCGSASPADCTVTSGVMSDLTKSYGGVVIESDKPIVVMINEVGFGSGLDSKLYEGFND